MAISKEIGKETDLFNNQTRCQGKSINFFGIHKKYMPIGVGLKLF